MTYNWQQHDWLDFVYSLEAVEDHLIKFAEKSGLATGVLSTLPESSQLEAIIETLAAEAIKTSEIEGEYLDRQDVFSSIRNNLGLNTIPEEVKDIKSRGAGELMVDVRSSYSLPLTEEKLFSWHKMIMAGNRKITAGAWRHHQEPMQIVSGAIGKEKIHYEAPPSSRVEEEMKQFIHWFNDTAPGSKNEMKKATVRSAIAHLYFETIHPFEDGNGGIGRAIAEKAMSQTLGRPVLLSLSRTIAGKKKKYYDALEEAQKSNEITSWINYFVQTVLDAQIQENEFVDFILKKTRFFDRFRESLNERQLKAVGRMLEAGPNGFDGGMSAKTYMSITKTSKATATRDLQQLLLLEALNKIGGGRNTNYELNL